MKEQPRSQAHQKAIDGILQSPGRSPVMPRHVSERLRRPGIRRAAPAMRPRQNHKDQEIDPIEAAQNLHPKLPPEPDVYPLTDIDMSIDEERVARPLKSGKRKGRQKGRIRGFFKRKWREIKSWSRRKKIIVGIITLAIIAALIAGGLFLKGYLNARKVFRGGGSAVSLNEASPDLLKGEGDGRVNILLLGIGGEGHDAPDLTDTIMIASIDPVNKKAALLSIPRDLWVKIPAKGSMKLNAVYETGKYDYLGKQDYQNTDQKAIEAGFKLADSTIEDVVGIPIHYHVLVNFQAFRQAVNAVGGIDVNVPAALYDPTMAHENGGSSLIAAAGLQHFDGTKALMYARSRHTSSDFARAERQRAIIVALQQKILTLGTFSNPQKIAQLMDAFGNNVVTDLSLKDVSRVYQIGKDVGSDKIASVGLTDPDSNFLTTGMISGQSVVIPRAGANNYDDIRSYVRNKLRDGYLEKENASVEVLNGTTTPGLAEDTAATLKSYGYNVGTVTDAPTKNYAKTTIIDMTNGKKPYTAQYLKKRFNLNKLATKLPDQTIQTQNADFVIILGENETIN
ncbi:MAG TPA: LCP family protein [Candidatus Saccharimonadales bacterium]|nr:LCP family protein [Candidatus Saccharimonadales bacterium]